MSWARDAFDSLKRIILLEERISGLTEQAKQLMDTRKDLDRRLVRLEAKFELLEQISSPRHRSLPE
jgi:hypothetical protein